MSESDKDNSEVYLRLAEHASQRYEALRNVEWKVDLGLWFFLISANALIINAKDYSPSSFVSLVETILVIVLGLLHMVWFQYIHEVQQRNNRTSYWWECKARMAAGEKHDKLPEECRPPADWKSPKNFSQGGVKPSKESRRVIKWMADMLDVHELHIIRLDISVVVRWPLTPAQWLVAFPRRVIKWLADKLNVHESHIMRLVVTLCFGLLLILVLWDRHLLNLATPIRPCGT